MTSDEQLAASKVGREGVPASVLRDAEMRRLCAELLGRSEALGRAVEQARLARGPVDLTPGIVGILQCLARSMALGIDGKLRARGLEPALQFRVPVEREANGNGDAPGPRLVVES